MPITEILNTTVSPELKIALDLLRKTYGENSNLQVVIRPEMFTHGPTLAWLREQIGPTDTHLCLSDGETVRVLSGMTNHVFFYRVGQANGIEGFLRLRRRAPELLAAVATQVNTAFDLVPGQANPPLTTFLSPTPDGDQGMILPFFVPRGPVECEAQELTRYDPVVLPASQNMTYAASSDAALQSVPFVIGLINRIVHAYTRSDHLLIIGASPGADQEDALIRFFSAIRQHALALPSGIPANVFLHLGGSGTLPGQIFDGQSRLVTYEAYAVWQRSAAFYAPFKIATVLREHESPFHETGLGAVLQTLTARTWEEVTLPDAKQKSLARYSW